MGDNDASKSDLASGIAPETKAFAEAAESFYNFCREEGISKQIIQHDHIEPMGDDPTLIEAIIKDVQPHESALELKSEFENRLSEVLEHLEPRVERLTEHTAFSEREAQVFLLDTVPVGTSARPGITPRNIRLVLAQIANRDELVTRQTVETYIDRATEKIEESMRTRYLAQFLGHPPDGYPTFENYTPRATVPLRKETLRRLHRRHRRASQGTTIDDIISAGLDATRTVKPIREFLSEYMEARPAAGVVVLTNQPPKGDNQALAIQGVVDPEHSQHAGSTTEPVRGIHSSQNPSRGDRPAVIRNTDAVSIDGKEYELNWNESDGYSADYMRWLYTNPEATYQNQSPPNVTLDEGVEDLVTWLYHISE
jgi:hypothetical protein